MGEHTEHIQEQNAQPELRQTAAHVSRRGNYGIRQGAAPHRADNTEQNTQRYADTERHQGQTDGDGQSLGNNVDHRAMIDL